MKIYFEVAEKFIPLLCLNNRYLIFCFFYYFLINE